MADDKDEVRCTRDPWKVSLNLLRHWSCTVSFILKNCKAKLVKEYKSSLKAQALEKGIKLVWVPGHSEIEREDVMTKSGASMKYIGSSHL